MLKVLMVDDQPIVLDLLRDMLGALGCTVFCAMNGRDGLTLMKKCHPDLVITDIRMPVMDGIQLARTIRQTYPGLPVAAFSATPPFGQENLFDAMIVKPADKQTVMAVLALVRAKTPA